MNSSIVISMSINSAESKFSEKFVKDLEKLVIWMGQNDWTLTDLVTGDSVEWNESLIDFEEPGRNKLECYIKELSKYYTLAKNGEEVDDIKTMIKEFRENKPKRINKLKEIKKVEENKKQKIQNEQEIQEIIVKNENDIGTENANDIDTEDACYIDTLNFSTQEIIKIFGEPLKNGKEDDKHQYEWKLLVITESGSKDIYLENIYSIYNWKKNGEFEEFNDNEWHLATMRKCPKKSSDACECQLEKIISYMKNKLNEMNRNETEIKNKCEFEKNNKKSEFEDKLNEMNQNETEIKNKCEFEKKDIKNEKKDIIRKMFNVNEDDNLIDNLIDIDDIDF